MPLGISMIKLSTSPARSSGDRRVRPGRGRQVATLLAMIWSLTGAACVAAQDDPSSRSFVDGVLISLENPRLAIKPAVDFEFVGRHPFRIRDVAAGERFVFVDADEDRAERLLLVQFEAFLPGVDNFFRYDLSSSPVVAGYPFRSNGFAFDLSESRRRDPRNESSLTADFLEERGLALPDQWMMWRSLTVPDPERRSEIIFFYVEDVASVGLTLDDLYQDERATEAWRSIQTDLRERAGEAFVVTTLDSEGVPRAAGWSAIP